MGESAIDVDNLGLEDRITLLKNLHRPLEEHWAGNKEMDAVGSDYSFKHHITRLEKMYTTNDKPRIDMGPPQAIANISPQTQLFGRGGIAPVLSDRALKKRESGWDPYMKVDNPPTSYGKVSAIQEKRVPPEPPRPQSRSRSPTARTKHHHPASSGYGQPAKHHNRRKGGERGRKAGKDGSSFSKISECRDPNLSREEVIMRGMYRFEPEERVAYDNFVAMLRGFDAVDKLKIIQSAYSEAEEASLMTFFGGAG